MKFLYASLVAAMFYYDAEAPDARESACLVYSPVTQSLLLIDGYCKHPRDGKSNVYSWDETGWKKIVASGPGTKTLSSGTLNKDNNEVVVFGGIGEKGYEDLHGDTWSFDGKTWHQLNTNDIGTRDHHKVVYDQQLHAVVMYGGQNTERKFDSSTWLLRGNTWTELKIEGPGARFHFGMAYDPQRKKVVLYGGYNEAGLQQDTWEFDGNKWEQITTDGPGPRGHFAMTYDGSRKMVVLYGGDAWKKKVDTSISADGEIWDIRGDTWGWDGKEWKKIAHDGPERMMAALGYDEAKKMLVLFGGGDANQNNHSDTWQLKGDKWVKVSDNGSLRWNGQEYEKVEE